MITAIFDLDGTLANTIQDIANAVNYGLRELGCPEHSVTSYKKMVGNGTPMLCLRALPDDKKEIKALEEAYAKAECPIVSNNSAHRFTPDVPMVVPEINPSHIEIIKAQRERLGTKKRIYCSKVKLLYPELCSGASSFEKIRT